MLALKRGNILFNIFIFYIMMFTVVGLTACSGKEENNTAAESSDQSGPVENEQDHAKETPEVQTTRDPILYAPDEEEEQIISGECGKDAVWTYNTKSMLLQITGTGVVDRIIKKSKEYANDYGFKKRYRVKEIQIGEGITALDAGPLFLNVRKAKGEDEIKLSLPDSLEKIGADTFDSTRLNCVEYFRHIHLPFKVHDIEGGAFWRAGDDAYPWGDSYQENVEQLAKEHKKRFQITVDRKNPYYKVVDGVLFTKDSKTLVYYPSEKTDQVYRIPKSVTHIEALAFARNRFLKEVVLPDGIQVIGAGAFFNCSRLAKINLEQAKRLKRLRDFDGVKHKICFHSTSAPAGALGGVVEEGDEDEDYDPAEHVKLFYESGTVRRDLYFLGTFAGTNLKSIRFPEHLKYAAYNTFKYCQFLKKISIGEAFAGDINPDRLCDQKGFCLPDCLPGLRIYMSGKNQHYIVKNHSLYRRKDGKKIVPHWPDNLEDVIET